MEELWLIDRQRLRDLLRQNPMTPYADLAAVLQRSRGWVKKWVPRLRDNLQDDERLKRRRCLRHYAQPARTQPVIERVLAIRDQPPHHLCRTPGPKAILYFLQTDAVLQASGVRLPRSTRTIWQILDQHQRIPRRPTVRHDPLPPVSPMQHWQFDFKDATSARAQESGKQLHQVEILNVVDAGTSRVVDNHVRSDFNAETTLLALASTFLQQGLPQTLTFDRDPRFVGAQQSRDFPSALVRFLLALGVQPVICPPQRPDKNPYVERFHRSLTAEALAVERPDSVEATRACVERYRWHYNDERPNQARSCQNRPPAAAFPVLPRLRYPPEELDPDAWLAAVDGRLYARRIASNGSVRVAQRSYYVQQKLRGQMVVLRVRAALGQFEVLFQGKLLRQLPIQGLHGERLPLQDYLRLICREAVSEARLLRKDKQHWSTM